MSTNTLRPTYRCPACRTYVEPITEGYDLVSYCCDEVVERVWLCSTCEVRESHVGCDVCFECVLDEAIADPRTIEMCAPALRVEIAKGLAERLRSWRTKEAA